MVDQNPKRSQEPPVWLLFSAGGMISALVFPALILALGILLPLGISSYNSALMVMINAVDIPFSKLILATISIFPMWAGLHRVHHGMHDLKIHVPYGHIVFYGAAVLYSIAILVVLFR